MTAARGTGDIREFISNQLSIGEAGEGYTLDLGIWITS
jgi:hypothetical protein